jgi:hypothetical protein
MWSFVLKLEVQLADMYHTCARMMRNDVNELVATVRVKIGGVLR